MSKKYYYTNAIVALYMMKEFGVKFECKDANGDVYDFQERYVNSNNISELSFELENFPISIYVKKQSQKIFKFKKSDLVKYGFGSVGVYNEISQKHAITEIIYRNGKQFFMPEVEQ